MYNWTRTNLFLLLKSITDESIFKFPTATMAKIVLKIENWNKIDDKLSKLLWIKNQKI